MSYQDMIAQIETAKAHLNQAQDLLNEVKGYVSNEAMENADQKAEEFENSLDGLISSLEELDNDDQEGN